VAVAFKLAWQRKDPQIERDATAFWEATKVLPEGVAVEERLRELCAAAYDDKTLVALTTAQVSYMEFLRAKLAMYRCAVVPGQRGAHIATQITIFTREVLEEWARANPGERVMGMGAVLQSTHLGDKERQPFWPRSRLTLVGHTAQGHQVRVAWFEHALLD